MKPMLAKTLGPKFDKFPCFVQPKLNGVRALYQLGTIQSRGEKIWKEHFFPHIRDEISSLGLPHILDGEFYVHGWRLQRINSAVGVNNNNPNEDTPNIEFHVFDVVDPTKQFSERWFHIYHIIREANLPHIKAVETGIVSDREQMDSFFHMYTRLGYEGIMLRPDGPYEFGEHMAKHGQNMTTFRSKFLWKHKSWIDDEFFCVGTTQGEGKADIGIGALVLTTNKAIAWVRNELAYEDLTGKFTFKVGTGFDDSERIAFAANPPIGKLIRVRYLELTADGIPFNPSFLAVMD